MEKLATRFNKPRRITAEISDGTGEGFYAEAKAIKNAEFGSILVRIAELGLFIKNANNYRNNFLATLYEGYDTKVSSKCIKGEDREPNLEGIPINLLSYSDFSMFKAEIKDIFQSIMQTGLARRVMLSFKQSNRYICKTLTDEEERNIYNIGRSLGKKLFLIFQQLNKKACFVLSPDAKLLQNEYKQKLADYYNNETDGMLQAEIISRDFKAIKLACLFACFNHPCELLIKPMDMKQAISIVEYLSQDFEKFLRFKPHKADTYDKVFEFFKTNLCREYTKTELIGEYFREIGISRDYFRKNFDYIIETVREIAENNDYFLNIDNTRFKNGQAFSLVSCSEKQLSNGVKDINTLINDDNIAKTSESLAS